MISSIGLRGDELILNVFDLYIQLENEDYTIANVVLNLCIERKKHRCRFLKNSVGV